MKRFSDLQRDFKEDKESSLKALQEYKQAKAYYHGNQLPPDVLSIIKERGQSPIVENIYKMIVNKILGYKIQSIQEVRLAPRQEQDKALSDLLNDLLRYFSQTDSFDKEIIKRDRDLIMGLSVMELWVKSTEGDDVDIAIKTLSPESFIIDKFSIDGNAIDARRFHKIINIDEESAKALLDGREIVYEQSGAQEKRAQIIESWYREYNSESGELEWNRYIWHTRGGIYKAEPRPFINNIHPFVIAKFYTDEKNQWYGLFRDIKPMQDYINYAENRMANMMGSFKAMFEEDSVVNIEDFIEDMSIDNAIVKVRSGALKENKIQFLQHHSDIAALSQKADQKRNLTKILAGLNDESLGVAVNRQSGVAIAQRRESGLMGLQDFIKISDDMDKLIFKKAVEFITHYFTKAQVFRIVDKKVGDRYFSINTEANNQIRPCRYDLIYKTQLKTESKDERFTHWNELLKVISPLRPDIVPELLPLMLKDIDSPLIADLEEILSAANERAAQASEAQAPLEQQRATLELEKLKAQVLELQAKAHKYTSQGELVIAQSESERQIQEGELDTSEANTSAPSTGAPRRASGGEAEFTSASQDHARGESHNAQGNKGSTWQKYPSAQNLQL